jgi:CHAT domain-containing protein/tetratricopeptide (TPR) repeat protein
MTRLSAALALGIAAAGWGAVAADEPLQQLTAQERRELEAKRQELNQAGVKAYRAGKLDEATAALEKALAAARQLYPKQDHPDLANGMNNLASVLLERGKVADAEPLFREALEMQRRLYPKQDHPELANSLNNLGRVLQARAKFADAEELFRDALEMRRRLYPKQDHPHVAISLDNLAGVLRRRGKYADAEPLYRESLEMRRRLYPRQDHPNLAASLNNLAGLLQDRSKYAEAEPLFRESLEMTRRLHRGQDDADVADSLNNLATLLANRGKEDDAEALFREALEMCRRLYPKQDHPTLARSLNHLGVALEGRAKYAEAESLLLESLAMRRRLYANRDHPDLANSLNNLGHVLQGQGRPTEAEPLFREALAMCRRLFPKQDHPYTATALNNVARVLQDQGDYAEAERLYREVLEMTRRVFPRQDHPALVMAQNNLAFVLKTRAKYAEAEELYRDSLAMGRRLFARQDHPQLVGAFGGVARVLEEQGKYAEAEALYRESLQMARRLFAKQDNPILADHLNYLAFVLVSQGKYAEAEPLFREALEMSRRLYPKDHPGLARSLLYTACLFEKQGKYAEAETFCREALEMDQRLLPKEDNKLFGVQSRLAKVLLAEGKYTDADGLLRQALKRTQALAAANAAIRSEGEALALVADREFLRSGFLSNAWAMRADPAAVYAEVWVSKAANARVYEQRALAARTAAASPKGAALLAQLTERRRRRADLILAPTPADPATRKQRDADLARCAREIDELDRDLCALVPAVERVDKLAKATPEDLRKALPPDAALVDYLRYTLYEQDPKKPGAGGEKWTDCYLAFVVARDRVAWVDLGPAKPIEDAVAAWREAIKLGKDVPPEVAAKVRELAWAKVRKELPDGVKTVYAAPDLELCRVPWAALPGDKPNTILLEDFAVAVVPHAVFLLDKLWPQDAGPKRPPGVFVVGGVAYDAKVSAPVQLAVNRGEPPFKPGQAVAWADLPGTAAEARGVAGAAAKKKLDLQTLAGKEATASAVLAALPRARYAHLATHGFFADKSFRSAFQIDPAVFRVTEGGERIGHAALSPLVMTGVVLAGANGANTPGRGILTGEALVDLDLSGLDLAVLSACETGLGDLAGGEGTFGLQRAFHLAGARNVVASLWKVPDQPTAALMALFYRNLWEKDLPPIEALRQAQLEVYRNPAKVAELAEGFRGKFVEVAGSAEEAAKPAADGKAHPRLWAAFTLSGPGR